MAKKKKGVKLMRLPAILPTHYWCNYTESSCGLPVSCKGYHLSALKTSKILDKLKKKNQQLYLDSLEREGHRETVAPQIGETKGGYRSHSF